MVKVHYFGVLVLHNEGFIELLPTWTWLSLPWLVGSPIFVVYRFFCWVLPSFTEFEGRGEGGRLNGGANPAELPPSPVRSERKWAFLYAQVVSCSRLLVEWQNGWLSFPYFLSPALRLHLVLFFLSVRVGSPCHIETASHLTVNKTPVSIQSSRAQIPASPHSSSSWIIFNVKVASESFERVAVESFQRRK